MPPGVGLNNTPYFKFSNKKAYVCISSELNVSCKTGPGHHKSRVTIWLKQLKKRGQPNHWNSYSVQFTGIDIQPRKRKTFGNIR